MSELSSNRIDGNGVQAETGNEKFTIVCSRSPQNLEFGHFTFLFARVHAAKKCSKISNARAGPLFFSLNPHCFVTF